MDESAGRLLSPSWGIVGYRNFMDRAFFAGEIDKVVKRLGAPARVVSGGATGADTLAREWAKSKSLPFVEHKPEGFGAAALLARNSLIVRDSDVVIAFLSKLSKGTHDTINKARAAGKKVVVINVD